MSEPESPLDSVLFPIGTTFSEEDRDRLLEVYKLFVKTSEDLVVRRQTVNAFFISVNTLLLSAIGLVAKAGFNDKFNMAGMIALSSAGILVCFAWIRLVDSFRRLNSGKFKVINRIEKFLPVSVFDGEWEALQRGRDFAVYKPFTATEPMVATVFGVLYVVAFILAMFVIAGFVAQ